MARCRGRGWSGTVEYQAASQAAWKWRSLIHNSGIDQTEIVNDLMPEAVKASNRWREMEGGMAQVTFIYRACRQAIWEICRKKLLRKTKLAAYDLRRDNARESGDSWSSSKHLEIAELCKAAMGVLSSRRRTILTLYCAGWKYEAIGDRHGITRERVRQIINRSVDLARIELLRIALASNLDLDDLRVA